MSASRWHCWSDGGAAWRRFTNLRLAGSRGELIIGRGERLNNLERDLMKFGNRKVRALAILAALAAAAVAMVGEQFASRAVAQAPAAETALNTLTEAEKKAGWVLLFDGKSLDSWRNYKKQTISDKWQVKDGAIVLAGKGGGDIVT